MPATIKDISRETGVSIATVSKVLNGNFAKVSLRTREEILDTARRLKYRPNLFARSLVTQRAPVLGVLLSDSEAEKVGSLLRALLREADKAGFIVMTSLASEEADAVADSTHRLIGYLSQGIAVLAESAVYESAMAAAAEYGVPCSRITREAEIAGLLSETARAMEA